jgi:MoaA/NifB/PqqE/SkfB family radical SAM enzyme
MAMKLIDLLPSPRFVVWDITYACPLRCTHCYSESGRRPSRQLHGHRLHRVADAMIATKPAAIVISGGEPLVVGELFAIAERMVEAGVDVILYTSGWGFVPAMLPAITRWFSRVNVSVDGATADVHDRIRGRAGSFDRAMNALTHLDRAIGDRRRRGDRAPQLGIDVVVTRSNFDQLQAFCTNVVPLFPELISVSFGAVIPTGLASRPSFADHELLTDDQAALLSAGHLAEELQALVPASVAIGTSDNRRFQLHPDLLAAGIDIPPLQVEPDGKVRAIPIYEGTVGSLLEEPLPVLWERAIERWSHPSVVDALTPATTMNRWAEATRRIDVEFGSDLDRARINRRPVYTPT